jgi:hypothetical protein
VFSAVGNSFKVEFLEISENFRKCDLKIVFLRLFSGVGVSFGVSQHCDCTRS